MVKTPHIFGKIKMESFTPYSTLRGEPSLEVSPESFKPIYMVSFFTNVLTFLMLDQTMNITFSSDTSVTLPSIRVNCGTGFHTIGYKR